MWGLILAVLIAILIAGFASLNSAPVSVNFLFWRAPEVSLAIVVLFSVLLGVILAALFGSWQHFLKKPHVKDLETKTIEAKDSEVENEAEKKPDQA